MRPLRRSTRSDVAWSDLAIGPSRCGSGRHCGLGPSRFPYPASLKWRPVYDLQTLNGHRSLRTMREYAHLSARDDDPVHAVHSPAQAPGYPEDFLVNDGNPVCPSIGSMVGRAATIW